MHNIAIDPTRVTDETVINAEPIPEMQYIWSICTPKLLAKKGSFATIFNFLLTKIINSTPKIIAGNV